MAKKGSVSKKFKDKKTRVSRKISYRTQQIRKRYLLVCEGEKTEPFYFKGLERYLKPGIAIIAIGKGRNTLTLVDQAIAEQKRLSDRGEGPDEVWVVMDRDSFPAANFDNAIHKCEAYSFTTPDKEKKNFKCAWSNESFELWYLLHFDNQVASIGRRAINKRISSLFGIKYDKAEEHIYEVLQEKGGNEQMASRRAEALLNQAIQPFSKANPATRVFELIKELNKFKK